MGMICAAFLWLPFAKGTFTLWTFLYAQFAGYFIAAVIALVTVLNKGTRLVFSFDSQLLKQIIKQSYPFAILFTLMTMYTRVDSVMLGMLLTDGEYHSGIYASAFRFLDASVMFAVLLANILLPMFSKMLAGRENVEKLVRDSFSVVLIAATILPFSTFFFGEQIYRFFYPDLEGYGATVTQWLFFNFIPMSMSYIFGTLLTASNRLTLLNYLSVGGLLLNIVLNVFLIPEHKALGATIATLITQGLVSLITFIICVRIFGLHVSNFINPRTLTFVIFSLLVFFLAAWLDGVFWQIRLLAAIILSVLSAFVIRILRVEEVFQFFIQFRKSGTNELKV
jgi:O-antigen/teichoic acid export membrane protein